MFFSLGENLGQKVYYSLLHGYWYILLFDISAQTKSIELEINRYNVYFISYQETGVRMFHQQTMLLLFCACVDL